VGLSARALLVPGDEAGHLAAELVASLMPSWAQERWLGIPVSPWHAEHYLCARHAVSSQLMRPLAAFRALGLRVEGELAPWTRRDAPLVADLPGATMQDKQRAFLALLPELCAIRDTATGNVRLIPPTHRARRVAAASVAPARRIRPQRCFLSPHPTGALARLWHDSGKNGGLGFLERVELLAVAAGVKQALRTSVPRPRWPAVRAMLAGHGLDFTCGDRLGEYHTDRGKGGWSNLLVEGRASARARREVFIYVARDAATAQSLSALEGGSDEAFGAALGYPDCCRIAFSRMFPSAMRHQGDLMPLIADQTAQASPWPWRLNVAARYFERALVSFYPCSFACAAAHEIAEATFGVLASVDVRQARALRRFLAAPILYTEYRGIYAFSGARWDGERLRYRAVRMTTRNRLGALLARGDAVELSNETASVFRGREVLSEFAATNLRLLRYAEED
jgi:hypothetical protein